ncbi:MAG: hypothetical protein ABIY90_15510 [Puia sp.]
MIFLVDHFNTAVDYSQFQKMEIVEIQKVSIPDFLELVLKYNITELSTAVKPYIFTYLFENYKADKIIYLDPDILIFRPFTEVFSALDNKNIIITPHILSGVDDDKQPTDFHTLRGGVFNLGFLALSDYPQVKGFLEWWTARTVKYGYCRLEAGMFYDQLWMNYVPCLFENYFILKHPGYNMANWNLHERALSELSPGRFLINQQFPLVFFHYSGYRWDHPENIGHYHTRFDFQNRPDLRRVFDMYREMLIQNNVAFFKTISCAYYEQYKSHQDKLRREFEKSRPSLSSRILDKIMFRVRKKLKGEATW